MLKTHCIDVDKLAIQCYDIIWEVYCMAFSYKPLWKLLIDNDMTKKQLMIETNISKSTMDKMGRGEYVSMEILDRLCNYFSCEIDSIIEYKKEK